MAPKKNQAPGSVSGFSEARQTAFEIGPAAKPGFGLENRLRLTLGPGGRLVIPAALRDAMEVSEGETILAWMEDGELHLLSPKVGARQAQAMLKGLIPSDVGLADEIIADRRREAEAENLG
jgi:bifunctional DNA-binding transcriptional regulator/antitoxin component of YhaV-PrlF toxin-antitoxin module